MALSNCAKYALVNGVPSRKCFKIIKTIMYASLEGHYHRRVVASVVRSNAEDADIVFSRVGRYYVGLLDMKQYFKSQR